MISATSFIPGFSLPENAMYVNWALIVIIQKVQLLPLFKGRSGHQNVTNAKLHIIYTGMRLGLGWGIRSGAEFQGKVGFCPHLSTYPCIF